MTSNAKPAPSAKLQALTEHLEKQLTDRLPTPEFVEQLIESGYFERTDLARIILQLSYYVFRDTSDLDRTTEALADLIGFCTSVQNTVKQGLSAARLVEDLTKNLVVADAMREVASRN